jgi:hypothetical protein
MAKQFRPRGIEADGLKYYQEQDRHGDYLSIDPESAGYYRSIGQPGKFEGRATAIAGLRSSVCTTTISLDFLRTKCHRVAKKDIPAEWLEVL